MSRTNSARCHLELGRSSSPRVLGGAGLDLDSPEAIVRAAHDQDVVADVHLRDRNVEPAGEQLGHGGELARAAEEEVIVAS